MAEPQYARPDAKRKYSDDAGSSDAAADITQAIEEAKRKAQELASKFNAEAAKRSKFDNGADQGFGSAPPDYSLKSLAQSSPAQGSMASLSSFPAYGFQGSSKKIEIPNGRVGVIIGKGGETIRNLQQQSGAKIQITRDMDHNPNSLTRSVELVGTSEAISMAEKLVMEVLAEADMGASGTNAPRQFSATGGETFIVKVPNNKAGLVIGKGGETIKSMQAKSGARIQLVPLHLPAGDPSTERTVYITGTQDQIELAKQLVNEVISENRVRYPQMTGGYSQQGYRPPAPPTSWTPPAAPQTQPGYGYMQPGAYPGAPPMYNMHQPPYAGYPQSAAPAAQQTTAVPGYDYYNQQPSQQPNQQSGAPSIAADATTYNYSQPSTTNYNFQAGYGESTFPQSTVGQQAYSQDGYSGGYNGQAQQQGYDQQGYGITQTPYGAPANPTVDGTAPAYNAVPAQGPPGQQAPQSVPSATQQGYAAQPSSTPASHPSQGTTQAGYGPSTTLQPGYGTPPPASTGYSQPALSTQPSYLQPAPAQGVYPQSQPGAPAQSAYGQNAAPYRPPGLAPGGPQQAYGQQQAPGGVAPQSQPGYAPQYSDSSYGSGGYAQPPAFPSDNSGATTQPVASGVVKASPQSG